MLPATEFRIKTMATFARGFAQIEYTQMQGDKKVTLTRRVSALVETIQ